MEAVLNVLQQVSLFNRYKETALQQSGTLFNVFEICGVDHYENKHSTIMASFLDPSGTHGMGSVFLEAFIQCLKGEGLSEDFIFSLSNVSVKTEYDIRNGRIDILISNPKNEAFIIENKIYAGEQEEQLKRYASYGKRAYKDKFQLVFLTLDGVKSPDADKQGVSYLKASYETTIINWLEKCIKLASRRANVRETLIQYSNHIKNLTHSNIETEMDQEFYKIFTTERNLEAAFTIANNLDALKNHLINSYFIQQLKEVADEVGLQFREEGVDYDYVNNHDVGFYFDSSDWENFMLFFVFGSKGLKNLLVGFGAKDGEIHEPTLSILKEMLGGGNNHNAYKSFAPYNTWNVEAMKAIQNGEMAKAFKEEIKRLLALTDGVEGL